MQACLNKLQHLVVRRVGGFAIGEGHHRNTDAVARIQYIVGSKSRRLLEDPTDPAFGAASSIRDRTNVRVLPDEHVHEVTMRFGSVRTLKRLREVYRTPYRANSSAISNRRAFAAAMTASPADVSPRLSFASPLPYSAFASF